MYMGERRLASLFLQTVLVQQELNKSQNGRSQLNGDNPARHPDNRKASIIWASTDQMEIPIGRRNLCK
jgi:hypothetical protein